MQWFKYLLVWLTPAVVGASLLASGAWTWLAVGVLFGVLPLLELFLSGSTRNLSEEAAAAALANRAYDWLLWSLLPLQYALLWLFLQRVTVPGLAPLETAGLCLSYGMAAGILGINAAHELGHRKNRGEQRMGQLLLLSSLYMHFFIEHNRGHHRWVATPHDPASARRGVSIYRFFPRTLWGSWRSAWALEASRLRKKGQSPWSRHNQMAQFQLLQLVLLLGIGLGFGVSTLICFVAAALVGILLLESVNYIEHYGLQRRQKEGQFERPLPAHSWNSNHPLGRLVLLELSRHADHHYQASRKYQLLRHHHNSPQMPTGYPGMILLALVPPLWFRVMHRRLAQYQAEQIASSAA